MRCHNHDKNTGDMINDALCDIASQVLDDSSKMWLGPMKDVKHLDIMLNISATKANYLSQNAESMNPECAGWLKGTLADTMIYQLVYMTDHIFHYPIYLDKWYDQVRARDVITTFRPSDAKLYTGVGFRNKIAFFEFEIENIEHIRHELLWSMSNTHIHALMPRVSKKDDWEHSLQEIIMMYNDVIGSMEQAISTSRTANLAATLWPKQQNLPKNE